MQQSNKRENLSLSSPTCHENLQKALQMISIKALFNESITGRQILAYYAKKNQLYEKLRSNMRNYYLPY